MEKRELSYIVGNVNWCCHCGQQYEGTLKVLCASLDGRRVWGRVDTCLCVAESPCCSPETTTALLIGYAPIQNKKFKVFKKQQQEKVTKGAMWRGGINQKVGISIYNLIYTKWIINKDLLYREIQSISYINLQYLNNP